jgi:hypothetical protein
MNTIAFIAGGILLLSVAWVLALFSAVSTLIYIVSSATLEKEWRKPLPQDLAEAQVALEHRDEIGSGRRYAGFTAVTCFALGAAGTLALNWFHFGADVLVPLLAVLTLSMFAFGIRSLIHDRRWEEPLARRQTNSGPS